MISHVTENRTLLHAPLLSRSEEEIERYIAYVKLNCIFGGSLLL